MVSPELAREYQALVRHAIAGEMRAFADAWTATGQRSWVSLGEVVAFTVRQAK